MDGEFICELCGGVMESGKRVVRVRPKRVVKAVSLDCKICSCCNFVGFTQEDLEDAEKKGVSEEDLAAFVNLQRVVSLMGINNRKMLQEEEEAPDEPLLFFV